MASPRWMKLLRDARAERGRLALMIAAVATSILGVGVVLGARAVLSREIAANYLGTRPAHATLEISGGVDARLLAEVRARPGIADAEPREVVVARARVGQEWRRLLLFVVDDFDDLRLNRFRSESGAWPPPLGTMLVERTAVPMLMAGPGEKLRVKTPYGAPSEIAVSGTVHDPGLAPAWQERSGYGYVTRATAAALGESSTLGELRVAFTGTPRSAADVEALASTLSEWLGVRGHPVHEIRVPPPGRHPHQLQMETILAMMLAFTSMALVLSSVLVASSLAALLGRQVREIGVMKALGARTGQIAAIYVALVGAVASVSVFIAVPLGVVGARLFAGVVSRMLNFTLTSTAVPAWVFGVEAAAGFLVPLAVSAIPVLGASRRSVRAAMDDHGVSIDRPRPALAAVPMPLRNALRRPARLALTLGLLAMGGAMVVTAYQVERGWAANVAKVYETRSYDVEVILHAGAPARLADRLRTLPGIRAAEAWGYSPAAFARKGGVDVVRTYPDRAHGSLAVMGPPPGTALVHFPVRAGRWLGDGDVEGEGVVLNHSAAAQVPAVGIGDPVRLSVDGTKIAGRVVGVVEEVGAQAGVYVPQARLARAMGEPGDARLFRLSTEARDPEERARIVSTVEEELAANGAALQSVLPLAEHRTAVGDHVLVLVRTLVAMAVIFAFVGALGLASAMGTNVVERTREIAVMRTLGATPQRLARMLLGEALALAGLSFVLACALSIPLTWLVGMVVGKLGFLAPLPLVFAPGAALAWLALLVLVAVAATLVPARRAAALAIGEAVGRV